MHRTFSRRVLALALTLTSLSVLAGTSWAAPSGTSEEPQGGTDSGRAFEPTPASTAAYGIKSPPATCRPQMDSPLPPQDECEGQKRYVASSNGTQIYVETSLPTALPDRPPVPEEIPTVLIMTPYTTFDRVQQLERHNFWTSYFVTRGYAVAIAHEPGTGNSQGCYDFGGPDDVDAIAHVIDYLGTFAPWSNGKVGMVGLSADATTQIGVATLGDPTLTAPLKAIVPVDPITSPYDSLALDGVPTGTATSSAAAYAGISVLPGDAPSSLQLADRPDCMPVNFDVMTRNDLDGNYGPFFEQREYRKGATQVRAATLLVQALGDKTVYPSNLIGLFDRLPSNVPHKLMLGDWDHAWPDRHGPSEQLPRSPAERVDFPQMVQAWFDRFLMGMATGVEEWPDVQVRDSLGQWRAEPGWPAIDGTFGQLALSADAALGVNSPQGSTSFSETPSFEGPSTISFSTAPLSDDLRISGQAVLDLSVRLSNPDGIGDAHIAAKLQAFGPPTEEAPDGVELVHAPVYGARSVQHLDPIPNGYFEQSQPRPAPLGQPFRVALRLMPTDLVVPAGGHIQLTIGAASASEWPIPLMPSGARSQVEILHSCDHPSVLRFTMPRPDADLLNVREPHEDQYPEGSLPSSEASILSVDGGGLANSKICNRQPSDPQLVVSGKGDHSFHPAPKERQVLDLI